MKTCMSKIWQLALIGGYLTLFMTTGFANGAVKYDYRERYEADVKTILASRLGMKAMVEFVGTHPGMISSAEPKGSYYQLDREQRMLVWQAWQNFLDHVHFFDIMGYMYVEVYTNEVSKANKEDPFLAAFACFLAQYRFAMDYIEKMEKNPNMHVILNEAIPEFGIAEGSYSKLKFRFLNVLRGAEFARLNVLYHSYKKDVANPLQAAVEEDIAKIWEAGKGKGPTLTLKNAVKVVEDMGFTVWFPVQKGVSEMMGNIKVWRPGITLISMEQIEQLKKQLRPGDILLQRREWYATNVGIPGFWTHAALYIGTPEERGRFFDDPLVRKWFLENGGVQGTIDSLLEEKYPNEYRLSVLLQEQEHAPRVIEAIAEGVSFTTLEHSASADSIAVLRPDLPLRSVAQAIIKAFHYSGRPYDFNFDFRTDSELVCSELIYKAYEGDKEFKGLSLPLSEVLDRPLLSPNEIAVLFDAEYGKVGQQFKLVAFLDGNEKLQKAAPANVEKFRKTWKRSKWHIWFQEKAGND